MSTVEDKQEPTTDAQSDKELNFRRLEQKFNERLERTRQEERERYEAELRELKESFHSRDDDDDPYVDERKLERKLKQFGAKSKEELTNEAKRLIAEELREEKRNSWLASHKDFKDVLVTYSEKLYEKAPHLAESILKMPDTFERQQLVYENIKSLGLDKPEQAEPSIQQKIDANRKSPYYQPTNIGASPYSASSDFSRDGMKDAYQKMMDAKNRMRI